MIHKISERLDVSTSGGAGLDAQSKTAGTTNLASIDANKYMGALAWVITAGGISGGATVDFKVQDSDDNSTFADVSGQSITQITASGSAILDTRIRKFRRYVRGVLTVGAATTVVGVVFIGQKRVLP